MQKSVIDPYVFVQDMAPLELWEPFYAELTTNIMNN